MNSLDVDQYSIAFTLPLSFLQVVVCLGLFETALMYWDLSIRVQPATFVFYVVISQLS